MPVTKKSANEVSGAIRKMVSRADAAIQQKNWGYAFEILRDVLLSEPGFVDARIKLRNAQLDKVGRQSSTLRQTMAAAATAWAVNVAGPMQLKKGNLAQALDIGEKAMEADPTVLPTLRYICKAAEAAELPDVAINALEVALEFHPKNVGLIKQLAELYEKNTSGLKAVSTWQKLIALQPSSIEAQGRLKHATALAAMEQAQWNQAESFRDVVKDESRQDILERASRGAEHDEESRIKLINALVDDLEKKPDNINSYRKLAELYHMNGNFDEAIECYSRISELTQTKDPAIDNAITMVMRDQYNARIRDLTEQMAADPENAETVNAAIGQIESERDNVLLKRYVERVQNYPNEPQFRMDLGEMYFRFERIDEALEQFQYGQRSAHHAPKAFQFMGKCFFAKGLYDMAIEQFKGALTNRERMRPGELKDIMYDMAEAYEKKGDTDAAAAMLKELYSIDVAYRDVAERMEALYRK